MFAVAVLILGGTITMVQSSGGLRPTDSAASMRALISTALPGISCSINTFRQVASPSLSKGDLIGLAEKITSIFKSGEAASVVVVQGTDTIEETSFFFDLAFEGPHPVVITGAMRAADAISSDGPANLVAAIMVAMDPRSRGRGCLVVLNNEVHAAADVRKQHTSALGAFASPNVGPMGAIVENGVRYFLPAPSNEKRKISSARIADVALHTVGLWDDGRNLLRLPDLGFEGLVLQGMGAGHVPQAVVEPVSLVLEQIPVVLTSRACGGTVHTKTYGYPGAEIELIARGVIPAGYLSSPKARVLLAMLIGDRNDPNEIEAAFKAYELRPD